MIFFTNLKIVNKLLLSFTLIIVTIISVNTIVWQKASFIQESNGWTIHTYEVLETLAQVVSGMAAQESGLRGYLVAGDDKFLEAYNKGRDAYKVAFSHVKQLTSDNAAQQTRLAELDRLANIWMNDIAEKEIEMMRKPETRDQARAMEASGVGRAAMDSVGAKVIEADKVERDLLIKRRATQDEAFSTSKMSVLLGGIGSFLLAGFACFLLTSGISRPITAITSVMRRLADREMGVEIYGTDRRDEVGAMAAVVQIFKDNMIKADQLVAAQVAENEAKLARAQKVEELTRQFEASVAGLIKSVASAATELQSTAGALTGSAEDASRQSTTVAAASEQATQNVQTVAASTEELTSSILEIGRQVSQSSAIIKEAVQQAIISNEQVRGLTAAADRIGDVVKMISDIASQTNLLALNATIEAARAGDTGKGFAVVASEVKVLANQTAKATDEIAAQIKTMQEATQNSVQSIQGITETIGKVDETSTVIASAVEQQSAATQEIARNVMQAAQGTQQVSSSISSVNAAAQQTGAAAAQVLASAVELSRNGEVLRAEVDAFLREVRAA